MGPAQGRTSSAQRHLLGEHTLWEIGECLRWSSGSDDTVARLRLSVLLACCNDRPALVEELSASQEEPWPLLVSVLQAIESEESRQCSFS